MNTKGIGDDIERILYPYLAVNSETCTEGERAAASFLLNEIDSIEYFRQNREQRGAFPIPGDRYGRVVCWGLILGGSVEETVVLMHHYDVAGVEDYKSLKDLAFDPCALEKALAEADSELPTEAAADLASGEFLFGKGTADMKAGGAIQLALLNRYSKEKDLKGNILLIAVPDEENLSAGMRGAVLLLSELKKRFNLSYRYAFNSEPHQRKEPSKGLLSEGSVGKMLAFVYARGFLSHAGKAYEGINPLGIISEIVSRTELSAEFFDAARGEAAPPPTWLYLRDRKGNYDVSTPLSAGGCVSILTLESSPAETMSKLAKISKEAFSGRIKKMNESYKEFCINSNRKYTPLPWNADVLTFGELLEQAKKDGGESFSKLYDEKSRQVRENISGGELSLIEGSFALAEFACENVHDLSPRVVIGLVPPYYPSASNAKLEKGKNPCPELAEILSDFVMERFGQVYDREFYFTGISDCSYCSLKDSVEIEAALDTNMPLYGETYSIPLAEIEALSMPCMNIGPWGKDFHKLTERVYKADLYERTHALLVKAIDTVFESEKNVRSILP